MNTADAGSLVDANREYRTEVRIETADTDADGRRIGARQKVTELLSRRSHEIQQAIAEAAAVVQGSGEVIQDQHGWQVQSVQATFGVKLAAETGVVLSKVSSEASFEVTITVTRPQQV